MIEIKELIIKAIVTKGPDTASSNEKEWGKKGQEKCSQLDFLMEVLDDKNER